jgi:hypothetical protein
LWVVFTEKQWWRVGIASACDYVWPQKRFNKIIRTGYRNWSFVLNLCEKNWETAMAEMTLAARMEVG